MGFWLQRSVSLFSRIFWVFFMLTWLVIGSFKITNASFQEIWKVLKSAEGKILTFPHSIHTILNQNWDHTTCPLIIYILFSFNILWIFFVPINILLQYLFSYQHIWSSYWYIKMYFISFPLLGLCFHFKNILSTRLKLKQKQCWLMSSYRSSWRRNKPGLN